MDVAWDLREPWVFFPLCYAMSVVLEGAVLRVALSPGAPPARAWLAAAWLTAISYPLPTLAVPALIDNRALGLAISESAVAAIEMLLYWAVWNSAPGTPRGKVWRDALAVLAANAFSYGVGEAFWLWQGL